MESKSNEKTQGSSLITPLSNFSVLSPDQFSQIGGYSQTGRGTSQYAGDRDAFSTKIQDVLRNIRDNGDKSWITVEYEGADSAVVSKSGDATILITTGAPNDKQSKFIQSQEYKDTYFKKFQKDPTEKTVTVANIRYNDGFWTEHQTLVVGIEVTGEAIIAGIGYFAIRALQQLMRQLVNKMYGAFEAEEELIITEEEAEGVISEEELELQFEMGSIESLELTLTAACMTFFVVAAIAIALYFITELLFKKFTHNFNIYNVTEQDLKLVFLVSKNTAQAGDKFQGTVLLPRAHQGEIDIGGGQKVKTDDYMVSYVNVVSNNDSTFLEGLSQFVALINNTPSAEKDSNLITIEAELTVHFITDNKILVQTTNKTSIDDLKADWDQVYADEKAVTEQTIDISSKFKATMTMDKLSGGEKNTYTSFLSVWDTIKFPNWKN
ncbi:UNKNOWN [Stylonychia lemnae]|uniref:Uncharacterized protein n=1 Tax=Stylonychia lemnae TaxID=5949 RepID=A0A078AZ07_STYLE|nr:UNKNOWN [Stylonychia lemnae]|eukprot:CDW87366.1 UNKNOWN [Stylonychia lemnae]